MQTVKEKLISMLVEYGMFEHHAEQVMEIAIPIIQEEAANLDANDGTGYHVTFDSDSKDYPDVIYSFWFVTSVKPTALKFIDDTIPQAWYRDMFL